MIRNDQSFGKCHAGVPKVDSWLGLLIYIRVGLLLLKVELEQFGLELII